MEKEFKLNLLLALYIGALFAANLLGGKLMPIGFAERGLTVSIIMFPFLFLITDIVGEVYGKKKANMFVNIGFISLVFLLLWQLFSISVPSSIPNEWYQSFTDSYHVIFSMTIGFTFASLVAFLLGQRVDVYVYHLVKKIWGEKNLWLRNNVSTIIGQFVDSSIWVFIAFFPRLLDGSFTVLTLFTVMILPYWFAKVIFAFIDTPLVYLGVKWLKK